MGSYTVRNAAALVSRPVGAYLAELERDWPVGARVRHAGSGWLGTVTVDTTDQAPGIADGAHQAHGLLFEPPYCGRDAAVVCVAWDGCGAGQVAWMRPGQLRRLPGDGTLTGHDADGHERDDLAGPSGRRVRTRRRLGGGR
jgi:hypothetical protein